MSREKTSQAKIFGMRLNPVNKEEADVMAIIHKWEDQGYPFKALAMDRILRMEGYTPEMFTQGNAPAGASYFIGAVQEMLQENTAYIGNAVVQQLEGYLTRFAEELTKELTDKLKASGRYVSASDEAESEEEENTGIARNFAKSFMQRQQKGK